MVVSKATSSILATNLLRPWIIVQLPLTIPPSPFFELLGLFGKDGTVEL